MIDYEWRLRPLLAEHGILAVPAPATRRAALRRAHAPPLRATRDHCSS
jgi:hypothetical protein